LSKSKQQVIGEINLKAIPKSLKIGPLSYDEWDLELVSFFKFISKQGFGPSASQVIQAYHLSLIDQFLTVDQGDLDVHYEANKEQRKARIEKWGLTLYAFIGMFNNIVASKLKKDPEELRYYTYSFLGIRTAQATINMRGELPTHVLESLNSSSWLGSPRINVRLFA